MKDHELKEKSKNEEKESTSSAYRAFQEFKALSDEQILEIDQFLKSYAELIYECFSKHEGESGKVITMKQNQNNLKAA